MASSSKDENIIITQSEKNYLPSFLFENMEKVDNYFNDQSSNCENDSIDEKEIIDKKNENEEKQFEHNNILEKNKQEKVNTIKSNNNEDYINKRIIYNKNDISYNNSINNNQNFYFSMPINNQKSFMNNSFNNRNSYYYYHNYFNMSNNNNNNNSNIINIINNNNIFNNNCINQNPLINPYSNSFVPISQINPLKTINLPKYFCTSLKKINKGGCDSINNLNYIENNPKVKDKKYSSFNQSFSKHLSSETKKKKKSEKDKYERNNLDLNNMPIKKLLNMADYSLYNYLITKNGSKDMQIALKKIKENEVEILIDKLKVYISDIALDKYGNYFIQKLIQVCVPSQRVKILQYINTRFVEISNNSFGTHPLQTLMEIINMSEGKKLVLSLILGNELILSLDSKGTHVLQKCISNTVDTEREQLNNNIINLIEKLIIDPFGVCVLIKLVKHTKDKSIRKKIANYITDNGPLYFIQHPYANYAVQILINSNDLSHCEKIIETIVNNYLSLSVQKFSSNVVENCIKYGDEANVKKIYKAIVEEEKLENL